MVPHPRELQIVMAEFIFALCHELIVPHSRVLVHDELCFINKWVLNATCLVARKKPMLCSDVTAKARLLSLVVFGPCSVYSSV